MLCYSWSFCTAKVSYLLLSKPYSIMACINLHLKRDAFIWLIENNLRLISNLYVIIVVCHTCHYLQLINAKVLLIMQSNIILMQRFPLYFLIKFLDTLCSPFPHLCEFMLQQLRHTHLVMLKQTYYRTSSTKSMYVCMNSTQYHSLIAISIQYPLHYLAK